MADSSSLPTDYMTFLLRHVAHDDNSYMFTNVALILAIVVSFVIFTVALNAAVFCYLRHLLRRSHPCAGHPMKLPPEIAALPVLIFSDRVKLAGTEAECVICLSELKLGEELNVLPRCNHAFHVKCIEGWWSALQFSCPTCRATAVGEESILPGRESA